MEAERWDVVVVGAGPVGLAAALAAVRAGWSTCLVGPAPARADGRTAALLDGSVRLLDGLGVWPAIEPSTGRLARLRIVDATDSLLRPPPVEFRAEEIGLDCFGRNVENRTLVDALGAAAEAAGVAFRRDVVSRFEPDASRLTLAGGRRIDAGLVVAADGRGSRVRDEAGIAFREHRYPQAAFTTILRHARPHGDVSTEFHTRAGPLTLVPLRDGHRSSLVWVTVPAHARRLRAASDAAVGAAVEEACGALLGRMQPEAPRGVVPLSLALAGRLTGPRLLLAGEAAHVLPPIGAQGLNLGFADIVALRTLLGDARRTGGDPGDPGGLALYASARGRDIRLRSGAVDALNRSLLGASLPLDALRGFGLGLLGRAGPIRRALMRAGLPSGRDAGPSSGRAPMAYDGAS